MLLYLFFIICILFIIAVSKTINSQNYAHLGLQVITITLIIFAACRYDVGVDYMTYYNIIHGYKLGAILRTEPLNQLIFSLTARWDSPFLCFLIYACITYIFVYKACVNNSIRPYLSIFLYITLFYLESLGYIRQAVSIAIGLYAFKYIKTQRFKSYCLWVGISMLFHLSAIILLAAYFIYWKVRLKSAIIMVIGILVLKELLFSAITALNFYSGYIDKEISGGSKLKYLYPLLLGFIGILQWNMNREKERLYTVCFLALPFPFIFPPHTGMRIGNYFFSYICFLIPLFFQESNYKIRTTFAFLTTLIFFIYILISKDYIPYRFYWEKLI